MKTLITILTFIFSSFFLNAATYTCSNSPVGGAQYSLLQNAYNACAASGDTILLQNTTIYYTFTASAGWNKNIVVIGRGLSGGKYSRITSGYSLFDMGTGSNGSEFHGIIFNKYLRLISGVSGLTFANCYIANTSGGVLFLGSASNIAFVNCVFTSGEGWKVWLPASSTQAVEAVFLNCIFNGYIDGDNGISHSILFDHCQFMRNSGQHLVDLKSVTVSNSIFMNSAAIANGATSGCTFLNNVYDASQTMPPALNTGSGNIVGTPDFTSFTGPLYSTSHDYDLLPGSVGIGAATNGTDIGLHGGSSGFSEALEPSIVPVVTSVVIQNTTVGSGGTLNVDIEARTPITD